MSNFHKTLLQTIGQQQQQQQQQQQKSEGPTIIEEKPQKPDKPIRKYQKGKFLGKGGFAKVYEFTNLESKKTSAAKIIPKKQLVKSRQKQKLISEIKIHRSLNHDKIVKFERVFEDSENVYILLEICQNQTLNELLKRRKRLTEIEIQCYLKQLLDVLKFLQEKKVIHRDLKLGNLFLTEKMQLKLGDFGLAAKLEFDGDRRKTICGTPNYIAPEVLEGKSTGHSYEADIWSFGVILYTLCIGKPPFETNDVKATYKKIKSNQYTFPEYVKISSNAKNLIQKILQTNPAKRPTLSQVGNHEFFSVPIPNEMPVSTMNQPPSLQFIMQYTSNSTVTSINKITSPTNAIQNSKFRFQSEPSLGKQVDNNKENVLDERREAIQEIDRFEDEQNDKKIEINNNILNGAQQQQQQQTNTYSSSKVSRLQSQKIVKANTLNVVSSQAQAKEDQKNVVQISTTSNAQTTDTIGTDLKGIDLWISKWIDYSQKYGLGYQLSNSQIGVNFNDNTKILFANNSFSMFDYIYENSRQTYFLNDYPTELTKKVTLLQHFKSYFEGKKMKDDIKVQENQRPSISQSSSSSNSVYLKKWIKTKHAIIFRFSNKVVQVIFQDKTEIILNIEQKLVSYVNKTGDRVTLAFTSAINSENKEFTKRLKYTQEILSQIFNNRFEEQEDYNQIQIFNKDMNPNNSNSNNINVANTNTNQINMGIPSTPPIVSAQHTQQRAFTRGRLSAQAQLETQEQGTQATHSYAKSMANINFQFKPNGTHTNLGSNIKSNNNNNNQNSNVPNFGWRSSSNWKKNTNVNHLSTQKTKFTSALNNYMNA